MYIKVLPIFPVRSTAPTWLNPFSIKLGDKAFRGGISFLYKSVFHSDFYGIINKLFIFFFGDLSVQLRKFAAVYYRSILIHYADVYPVSIGLIQVFYDIPWDKECSLLTALNPFQSTIFSDELIQQSRSCSDLKFLLYTAACQL